MWGSDCWGSATLAKLPSVNRDGGPKHPVENDKEHGSAIRSGPADGVDVDRDNRGDKPRRQRWASHPSGCAEFGIGHGATVADGTKP